jgi:hypothetical protein
VGVLRNGCVSKLGGILVQRIFLSLVISSQYSPLINIGYIMANLLLKVGDSSGYDDGDILVAPNRKRIRCVHASHLCHTRLVPFNSDGYNSIVPINQTFLSKTNQYRFDRVSQTEVLRTDLLDNTTELFSDTTEQYIHVQEFINHQKEFPNHMIFGTEGNEFWYGKEISVDHDVWDDVWAKIEEEGAGREINFKHFPFTEIEHKHFLPLTLDNDFTDEECNEYVAPEVDEEDLDETGAPKLVSKRRCRYQWEAARLGVSSRNIRNRQIRVDILNVPVSKELVIEKPSRRVR